MVYKKYITRNGKVYGPYTYHSRRVNGKVVSEYYGAKKVFPKKFLGVFFGLIFVGLLIFVSVFFSGVFSGQAILGIDANYVEGETLTGDIHLVLNEGELIPADSKLIFENGNQIYEFDLRDVVKGKTIQGDFYAVGNILEGNGNGYGVAGEKEIYPEVDFILNILTEADSGKKEKEDKINKEKDEVVSEGETEEDEMVTEEEEEIIVLDESELEEDSSIIEAVLGTVSNFFLSLTGQVSLEVQNEISGTVSGDEPFTYFLEEGQTVELVSSSQDINLDISDGGVTVTTDYLVVEKGFGQDYLGDGEEVLTINLNDLNLVFGPGELEISLVYGEEEIISLTTNLGRGEVSGESDEVVSEIINESVIFNVSAEVNASVIKDVEEIVLTHDEKEILVAEFGNVSVETTKAELVNERVVVKHELGNYWVEYSYDSIEEAEALIDSERIQWLKDLADAIVVEEEVGKNIEGLIGEYDFE